MENRSWTVIPSDFLIDTHFRPFRQEKRGGGPAARIYEVNPPEQATPAEKFDGARQFSASTIRHKSNPISKFSAE